ncbi:Damage-inducible protein CinA [Planctomycetales bacterium 10988]|nr:Damage-inducible protein CinA [Planctomycetales bacterium 10988]
MIAEVLAIGDELTSGHRLDTNSQWLSQQLGEIGISVQYHGTAGDQLTALRNLFQTALQRSDLIVCTGGLGPTDDDLTREALAAATSTDLVLDEDSLANIQNLFKRRGRTMPERNRKQAMFPQGSQAVPNPEGSAPGIEMTVPRSNRPACQIFCFPGVPAEMKQMWRGTVLPKLTAGREVQTIRHHVIKCFGVGESHLESMLPDVIARGREPSVGITVHHGTISLRISTRAADEEAFAKRIEPTRQVILDKLGTLVFGSGEEELQHAIARTLRDRGETVATAEGNAGGRLADWLGELPGSEDFYRGGIVGASSISMGSLLVFPKSTFEKKATIDQASIVEQAALAVRERLDTDWGLATSEYPHLSSPEESAPAEIPKFYVALANRDGVQSKTFDYSGHSAIVKDLAAKRALNLLRLALSEESR